MGFGYDQQAGGDAGQWQTSTGKTSGFNTFETSNECVKSKFLDILYV